MDQQHQANILKFNRKIADLAKTRSRELRISTEEAQELSAALVYLLMDRTSLQESIIQLQKNMLEQPTEIILKGGGFK